MSFGDAVIPDSLTVSVAAELHGSVCGVLRGKAGVVCLLLVKLFDLLIAHCSRC